MKRKITFLIAAIAAIMLIASPVKVMGQANVYTSNVSISNGTNTSDCTVDVTSSSDNYAGHKLGASSKTGSITITVHSGTTKLLIHAAAWKDKSTKITASATTGVTISPATDVTLTADAGIQGSGTDFSLDTPGNATTNYYKTYTLTGVSSDKTITIATKASDYRAVIWGVNAANVVTFNGNGGSTATKATSYTQDVLYNTATALTTNLFTRDGFNFTGWNTQADGEGTHYNAGASVTRTSDLTLYAEWVAIGTDPSCSFDETSHNFGNVAVSESASYTFTVSTANLEGNLTVGISGTGYSVEPSTINQAATSTEVTVTFSPTVAGAAPGTVTISGGGLVSNVTASLSGTGAYKVTYDANGGTGTMTDSNSPYTSGSTVTVLANSFTWFGHTFKNWNTKADGSGSSYSTSPAGTFSITQNTTLYAQWDVKPTYSLVTDVADIVPGAHYVIASNKVAGSAYAMGGQHNHDYRYRVEVTIVDNSGIMAFEDVTNLYEFVLSGYAENTTYKWTFYDKTNSGYLYAAGSGSGNNYLDYQTTNDANGLWSISIDDETNVATIVAQGTNTNKKIQHNNSASRFSCYSTNQGSVYLYMRDNDTNLEFYSDTKFDKDVTASDDITLTNALTLQPGAVLDMNGNDLTIGSGGSLTIEGNAQLIVEEDADITVTIKRHVTGESRGAAVYEAFASTVYTPAIGTTNLITASGYDLFMYDNTQTSEWRNYKAHTGDFANLENCRGYLYRNAATMDITITGGTLNTSDISTYTLTNGGSGDLKGFHLIGNPYQMAIYKGVAISNDHLKNGYYAMVNGAWVVKDDGSDAIAPGAGILVQAKNAEDGSAKLAVTYNNSEPGAKAGNDKIKLIVSNSQYEDVAYALFEKGEGLNKITHRNAEVPMLYIPQNGENFAIAMMEEDAEAFNLNFKAMTTGKYTLRMKPQGNCSYLHVIDKFTGEDVDMLLEGEYSFIGSAQDNDNRFIVRLNPENAASLDNTIFAYQNGNDIIISGEGELQIFDVTGRKVSTQRVNGVETINLQSQGVYIFRLIGNEIKTQKIVVK